MNTLQSAPLFLVNTLFSLYIFALLMRFILQYFQASHANPISQFITKITDPVITPLKQHLPRTRAFDLTTAIVILFFQLLKVLILFAMQNYDMALSAVFVYTIADLFSQVLNIFFFAILIKVIISWVNPTAKHPGLEVVHLIAEPILEPIRRIIPAISGFDMSPVVALIGLKLIEIIIMGVML